MELPLFSSQKFNLIVVGGGAAGFMAAITASEAGCKSVLLLEGNPNPLEKVRISGGGRCNVTHACWDPKDLSFNYPRGQKNLLNSFRRFASGDSVAWFAERGVDLITESDGRMFPSSNSSSEIIDCLRKRATLSGVILKTSSQVKKIKHLNANEFIISCRDGTSFFSRTVLLATGSNPSGRKIASELGHQIVTPIPSLFSFQLSSDKITSCSGLAIDNVDLNLITSQNSFHQRGRILITHWGLSGPAILRLSSFAARNLFHDKYKAVVQIDWVEFNSNEIKNLFEKYRNNNGNKSLSAVKPFSNIPKRLWYLLLEKAKVSPSIRWAELTKLDKRNLIDVLKKSNYFLKGRGPFRDEFVTAGGIDLSEVDFLTMESRKIKGLFFAGEVLDIDGLTGGFNFQHCWTSGWIAGLAISSLYSKS